jgi:hypothetical protein
MALTLAARATTALAETGGRGGGRGVGEGRMAPGYAAGRGYGGPGYARPNYAPPPSRYAPPPRYAAPPPRYAAPAPRRYAAPSPYEPPLAPYPYRSEDNSLGAQWAQQQDQAQMGVRQGRIMPLARVVANLTRLRPGRVLDAGLETAPDGRATYRVRWAAAGGRRIDFIIDAETGAVIGRGPE